MGEDQLYIGLVKEAEPEQQEVLPVNEGFGFRFSDKTYMVAEHVDDDNGFQQYKLENKEFAKDQIFQLINFSNGDKWAVAIDGYSFGGTAENQEAWKEYIEYDAEAQTYKVLKDFTAKDIYIKLKQSEDQVFFALPEEQGQGGEQQGEQGGEEEQEVLPANEGYGFRFSDKTYFVAEHVGQDNGFDQYKLENKSFTKDQVFQLINFSNGEKWAVPVDGYSFGGTAENQEAWKAYLEYDVEAGTYTVLQNFQAKDIYIKLKYNADQIYFALAEE